MANPLPGATPSTQTTITPSQTKPSVTASLPVFIRPLYVHSVGKDVAQLQALLGVEQTGYFGALTRAAVEAFQVKYGIAGVGDAGYGIFGPKTRTKVEEVFNGTSRECV